MYIILEVGERPARVELRTGVEGDPSGHRLQGDGQGRRRQRHLVSSSEINLLIVKVVFPPLISVKARRHLLPRNFHIFICTYSSVHLISQAYSHLHSCFLTIVL